MAYRAIRPAGSSWLRARVHGVSFQTGLHVVAAARDRETVDLKLSNGTELKADHVLLGTGYKISVSRMKDPVLAIAGRRRSSEGVSGPQSGIRILGSRPLLCGSDRHALVRPALPLRGWYDLHGDGVDRDSQKEAARGLACPGLATVVQNARFWKILTDWWKVSVTYLARRSRRLAVPRRQPFASNVFLSNELYPPRHRRFFQRALFHFSKPSTKSDRK